jgi:hypothetical protein
VKHGRSDHVNTVDLYWRPIVLARVAQGPAFVPGGATPDTVVLAGYQGVRQAARLHRAAAADSLRRADLRPHGARCGGREKEVRILGPAGAARHPAERASADCVRPEAGPWARHRARHQLRAGTSGKIILIVPCHRDFRWRKECHPGLEGHTLRNQAMSSQGPGEHGRGTVPVLRAPWTVPVLRLTRHSLAS